MLAEADMMSCAISHEEYFLPDVAMGDASGLKSLKQAWRWSRQCGDPERQLKRVESITLGVMTATAELSLTVTEGTLDSFFPKLQRKNPNMSKRLLGQRLQLTCSITFLLDEETGRVAQLEHDVDFVAPLLHVLGSLEDVSSALNDHSSCSK
ncbi:hypothetical protein PHYSODRAFT_294537 [Phytophthora sojae]|uniref:Bzip transcription factor n=1 Tax=Phytophthora sojae (strain P6497) TaxID=1094619 RepID=G4YQ18_PHYSP|nr:hypothetical protein PHYSODRAFT_294537 [Phytophthora sojae]EGZ29333.1 hypothetical protein PHYSODRAFT_294537 [Phytophthora sojae]|eukprot:XP_009516608.1 hypothetical protein PHYSODRAFT_294537 [Phytophthora sojae]